MSEIDQRKVRLYQWMLDNKTIEFSRIPVEYQSSIKQK